MACTATRLKRAGTRYESCRSLAGLYVGHVPGFPGAHSQGTSVEELKEHLREVIELLLEDGEPDLESELIGIQTVAVD